MKIACVRSPTSSPGASVGVGGHSANGSTRGEGGIGRVGLQVVEDVVRPEQVLLVARLRRGAR